MAKYVFESEEFQKYEDPDETGPEHFFDSIEVYNPDSWRIKDDSGWLYN